MAKNETVVNKLSYEKALAELESIVQQLENQSLEMETTLKYFERGRLLLDHCQQLLAIADLKVRKLSKTNNTLDEEPSE